MCAIDALGISAMTGLPVVIESADPSTGAPITVNVDGASSTWDLATQWCTPAILAATAPRVGIWLLRVHELLRHPGRRMRSVNDSRGQLATLEGQRRIAQRQHEQALARCDCKSEGPPATR
jgi:hypothetical protein